MGQGRFFQKSVFLKIIMLISLFHIHKISALSVKSSLFSRALERSQKIQNRNLLTDSSFEMIEEDCYPEDSSLSGRNGSLSHKDSKISTVKINEHKHIGSEKKPYVCVICQRNFKEEFLLKMHQEVDTIEAPYECYSSKDFSGKMRHNRRQKRQASYCNKRKALKYKLRQNRQGNPFEFSAPIKLEDIRGFLELRDLQISQTQENLFEDFASLKTKFSSQVSA